jgi:hypothetical protein
VSIIYRRVKYEEARGVIDALLPAHHAEFGDADLPLAMNWDFYCALEKLGHMFWVVASEDERPIGYAFAFVHPHPSSIGSLVGTVAIFFVEERPGRALLVRSLLGHTIWLLKSYPIRRVYVRTDYERSVGRLLEPIGFEPIDVGYGMVVETREAAHARAS